MNQKPSGSDVRAVFFIPSPSPAEEGGIIPST